MSGEQTLPVRAPQGSPTRRTFGRVEHRRRVVVTSIIVVVLLNVVVVAIAVGTVRSRLDPPGDPSGGVSTLAPDTVDPSHKPGSPTVSSDRWLVDINQAGFALRARSGECAAASGTAEQSTDNGRTWLPVGLASLVVIHAVDAGGGAALPSIIGTTPDCQDREWWTPDGGRTWRGSSDPPSRWFRDPDRPSAAYAPGGPVPAPCLAEAAVVDARAEPGGSGVVLCADGLVARSFDGGKRWLEFGRVPRASSVMFSGDRGYAASSGAGCSGVQVLEAGPGGWSLLSCVANAEPAGAALAIRGEAGLLVTFNGTWLTSDGGRSWALV